MSNEMRLVTFCYSVFVSIGSLGPDDHVVWLNTAKCFCVFRE